MTEFSIDCHRVGKHIDSLESIRASTNPFAYWHMRRPGRKRHGLAGEQIDRQTSSLKNKSDTAFC